MVQAAAESMEEMRRDPRQLRRLAAPVVAALAALAILAAALTGCGSGGGAAGETTTAQNDGPSKPAPASFFGVVPQEVLADSDFKEMGQVGVGTLRAGLYWQQVQPYNGASYDFSRFDTLVRSAAENGFTVLPFLYGTPTWAGFLDGRDCNTGCTQYAAHGKFALRAWQAFVKKAAARYGPGGEFWNENPSVPEHPISDWQIWNEQNSKTFYLPGPNPEAYEKLLAAASDAIRSENPKATIILGGIFGTPGGGDPKRSIPAATFLHELLAIDGAKDEFDGYALHPYSHTVRFVHKQVDIARRELSRSGFPDASLWVTEVGWASGGTESALNVGSQAAQAERVGNVYDLFEQHRDEWNVKLVAWFAWQDSHASDDFCFFCAKAGLLDDQGKPKQALGAYEDVVAGN